MPDNDLLTRGVQEVVPMKLAEEKLKSGKCLRVYFGIDPTGAKLHLGHSVPLRKLQAFSDTGHEVIFLIGSATAMIGDPTGKDIMRQPLTRKQVEENFATYKQQASKILDFTKVLIRYNHDWLDALSVKETLKLASHFTSQQMLQRDMFKERLKKEQDITLTEFMYPMLQGYDSVVLDVDCEVGGSDQLFNMLCGRKLQKAYGKRDKFVLTTKLIEGMDGRKMSKTYDNCIWLEDPAIDMYGKVLRINDDMITLYMECCTDIPMKEIEATTEAMKAGSNPKDYKMQLARAIVTLYHGETAAKQAEEEFQAVYRDKGVPRDIQKYEVKKGIRLIDALVNPGIVSSTSDFRRLVSEGAIKMNGQIVRSVEELAEEGVIKIGKKKFSQIEFI